MASIDRSFESSFPAGRFGAAKNRLSAAETQPAQEMPRDRVRDLTALALLAGVLFLVASLATYHPADPPGARAFPPHARAVNACGFIGSAAAGTL
ncbi:MAG: DNA translocase FtsK 4TM domain-containing protein, partial [Planctomycetia bacterium]